MVWLRVGRRGESSSVVLGRGRGWVEWYPSEEGRCNVGSANLSCWPRWVVSIDDMWPVTEITSIINVHFHILKAILMTNKLYYLNGSAE